MATATKLAVDARCEIQGKMGMMGTIRFVGPTEFATGKWLGVELDEPSGKNNGSVMGKHYFDCKPNHGVFVRASQIKILNSAASSPQSQVQSFAPPNDPNISNGRSILHPPSIVGNMRINTSGIPNHNRKGPNSPTMGRFSSRGLNSTISAQAELTNLSGEEWIKKKMEEEDINYFEYSEFNKFIEIGKGGFGFVHKAETNDKKQVALKSLKDSVIDENVIKNFIKELKLLRKVSYHENIISFLGISKDDVGYVMVLEYASGGNLREYLKKNFDSLQWKNKIQMAFDITCGLKCLHSKNIIHRDLHSKNILVNNSKLLIADLGLSKHLTEVTSNSTSNKMGIIEYIEPQCLMNVNYVKDKRSDVYGLGVLLWEITSGHPPFHNIEERSMLGYHISRENLREKPIKGTPSEYQQLYQKCWDGDPDKRPDINQIYNEISSQFNVNDEDSLVASNNDSPNSLNIQSGQSDLCIDTAQ